MGQRIIQQEPSRHFVASELERFPFSIFFELETRDSANFHPSQTCPSLWV